MQEKCVRNRKRSKPRPIYCPLHRCRIESVSQKHSLYADCPKHLQQRGVGKFSAQMLIRTKTTVILDGEWLEAFWCDRCDQTKWYHVRKCSSVYNLSVPCRELWQRASGVTPVEGNPSVGEFTQRQARGTQHRTHICTNVCTKA